MVRELQHRNGLVRAIEGRTATDLEPLLMFVMTHITSTKYAKHVMVVAEVILGAFLLRLRDGGEVVHQAAIDHYAIIRSLASPLPLHSNASNACIRRLC